MLVNGFNYFQLHDTLIITPYIMLFLYQSLTEGHSSTLAVTKVATGDEIFSVVLLMSHFSSDENADHK